MHEPTICGVTVKLSMDVPVQQVQIHPETWMEILAYASEGKLTANVLTVVVPLEEIDK